MDATLCKRSAGLNADMLKRPTAGRGAWLPLGQHHEEEGLARHRNVLLAEAWMRISETGGQDVESVPVDSRPDGA